MGIMNNIGQKFKGKAQQLKGKIEIASGQHMKGNVDKLRGKANEIEADIRMKIDKKNIN